MTDSPARAVDMSSLAELKETLQEQTKEMRQRILLTGQPNINNSFSNWNGNRINDLSY